MTNKKTNRKTIVISDLHLDRWTQERRAAFHQFLDHVIPNCGELIVLGDSLDFPALPGKAVWPDHRDLIDRIFSVSKKGVDLTCVIGNHDIGLRGIEIADRKFRLTYIDSKAPLLRAFGDTSVYLEHGHDYDPLFKDHIYDALGFLDRLVGTELEIMAVDFMRDVDRIFKRRKQSLIRSPHDEPGVPESLLKLWENAAEQILKKHHYNIVIFGHTHAPLILPMLSKNQYYVNTGDWLTHSTYVEIDASRLALKDWLTRKTLGRIPFKKKA